MIVDSEKANEIRREYAENPSMSIQSLADRHNVEWWVVYRIVRNHTHYDENWTPRIDFDNAIDLAKKFMRSGVNCQEVAYILKRCYNLNINHKKLYKLHKAEI
jgi:hypothetical protein